MKANELRIGNWVNEFDKQTGEMKPIQIDYDWFYSAASSNDFERNYYPIPLTPEILEKCGFEEWSEGHWKIRKSLVKWAWSEKFNYYLPYKQLSTYIGGMQLKYLHQLSNIYIFSKFRYFNTSCFF